jgi:hypothetical protein
MAMNNFVVFAARYDTLDAAESDKAVRHLHPTSGLIDTCDAAVITRDHSGRVCIVAKHERPRKTRKAWRAGAGPFASERSLLGEAV